MNKFTYMEIGQNRYRLELETNTLPSPGESILVKAFQYPSRLCEAVYNWAELSMDSTGVLNLKFSENQ